MALPSTIEACKLDFFDSEEDLRKKYPAHLAERIMRVREIYNYWLANPDAKDRIIRDRIMSKYNVSQSAAYSDLAVLHQLIPLFSQKSRDFHRARFNEMILETYAMAKARKDTKTMERASASYAKFNRVDLEDEMTMPYDDIVIQPFVATNDPTVLGIKPIPNYEQYVSKLTKELAGDLIDVLDVEYEEADLEEDKLFAPIEPPDEQE
jgi:hypothetical protein